MKVYKESDEKEVTDNVILTDLEKGMKLSLKEMEDKQHFTQPPAHFTESSLVKALEEQGIGRPSTYAPTITTIIARRYVIKEDRNLFVTEMGEAVNKIMKDLIELMDPKYIEVWGKFTPRGGISIDPYANYGKPGTKWEQVAWDRMRYHDMYPEKVDNR